MNEPSPIADPTEVTPAPSDSAAGQAAAKVPKSSEAAPGLSDSAAGQAAAKVSESSEAAPGLSDSAAGQAAAKVPKSAVAGRGSNLDQLMPVVLFLVFYNLVNTELAVLAATAWSVKAAYSRHRRGLRIGIWLPGITVYLMLRAAISIAVERDIVDFGVSAEAVYFGIGIGTKILLGLAATATIVIGRPFAVWAVRWVVDLPESVRTHRRYITTLRNVTWVIAVYEIGSAIWDIWLFNNSGVTWFVVTRYAVNYGVSFGLILICLLYVEHRLSKVPGWPGLVNLFDSSVRRKGVSHG